MTLTNPHPLPPLEEFQKLYRYDPETGLFSWLVDKGKMKAGMVAGGYTANRTEKIYLRCQGKAWLAHRVAWLFHYGEDPGDYQVDHKDKNPLNNKIDNLRLATHQENQRNTKGLGVSWHTQRKKWRSYIMVDYRQISGGLHNTFEEALAATAALKRKYFGEFCPEGI